GCARDRERGDGSAVQDPPRPARDARRPRPPPLLDGRDPERPQRAARRDVARRSPAAAAARLREARAVAPAPLERAAGDDRFVADRRPQRPLVRRPRPPRFLLPRELVALARRLDPDQDDPRRARDARRVLTRVVFVTQQFDPDDPNLGLVVAQVAALARRVDEVVVVAGRVVADALPPNARGRSFAARTQLGRGARLLLAVARELPGLRRGAVIAHQVPLYAIVLAPLVRPARVPLVLWWSHWKLDLVVRAAEAVS